MKTDINNKIEIPSDLDASIERLLDGMNAASKIQQEVIESCAGSLEQRRSARFRRVMWTVSAAALLVLVGLTGLKLTRSSQPKDTFDDPQLAYAEVERVLASISSNMKASSRGMEKADAIFEMQQEIFNGTYIKNKKK